MSAALKTDAVPLGHRGCEGSHNGDVGCNDDYRDGDEKEGISMLLQSNFLLIMIQ